MKSHERELMSGRIRSPSDLMRMNEEVGHMKAALAEEEDSELEVMAELEALDELLAAARRDLAEAEKAHAEAEPGMRARLEAVNSEVAALETERESLWDGVPEPLRAAYRKISRIPNPVVAEERGQCMGCRVQLTANELQQLRRGERFTCQNCNRILVLS
jgi:predicted  nucleic acid-binding Zn-ribbon protein